MVTISHCATMSSSFSTLRALIALAASGIYRVIEPQKLLAIEGLQSLQDSVPDSTTAYGTDNLTLEVKGITSNFGNVPVVGLDLLVSWNKVANQKQDGHYHVSIEIRQSVNERYQ